jgi:hypothetical protein
MGFEYDLEASEEAQAKRRNRSEEREAFGEDGMSSSQRRRDALESWDHRENRHRNTRIAQMLAHLSSWPQLNTC